MACELRMYGRAAQASLNVVPVIWSILSATTMHAISMIYSKRKTLPTTSGCKVNANGHEYVHE